jgi:hypothetical protein
MGLPVIKSDNFRPVVFFNSKIYKKNKVIMLP